MATAKKPSRPWRVTLLTPGAPITSSYTSERTTYEAVIAEKKRITAGTSRVTRIRIDKWDRNEDRWVTFDRPYPEQ